MPERNLLLLVLTLQKCKVWTLIKPRILFEVDGVTREEAEHAFRDAGHKLPIKTKIVERRVY